MQDIEKLLADLKPYPLTLEDMVQQQIIDRGISDKKVINAFLSVDRKIFLPAKKSSLAYADQPVAIGHNQTISQPYVVAFMTEKLGLDQNAKVLEVGTGCGYQTAILASITKMVYSIEVIEELIPLAKHNLRKADIKNVEIFHANGRQGLEEYAMFSHIIVTAGSMDIPPKLVAQLEEGGKMIIPVGQNENQQELLLITKKDGIITQEELLPVRFVPLV